MLNNLDIYKLRLLDELAATGSVSRTAAKLNVTPSAVSQTVKLLERHLGKQLFLRVGKAMQATPLTHHLCARTKDYFNELSQILDNDAFNPQEIRIGAPPLFGVNILTDFVCSYSEETSKSKFIVSLKDTHQLIESLLQGKFDFVFLDETPSLNQLPEIAISPCFKEELILCGSAKFIRDHKLPTKPSLKALQAVPHIPYHTGKEAVYKWYSHHFKRVPDLKYKMAIDQPLAVLNAITKGHGLGVLPLSCLRNEVAGSIIRIDGPKGPLINRVQIAQLRDKKPSAEEKNFIRMFLKMLSQ